MQLSRPVRTRFRYGFPTRVNLATQRKLAGSFFKRHAVTVPKNRSNGLYAHGFRYYFTPLPGYFSPFPHGTSPLSVIEEYLGLAGGPARFTPNFRGSVLLGVTQKSHELTCTGLSPSTARLSNRLSLHPWFMTLRLSGRTDHVAPQHPKHNARRLSHA